MTGIDQGGHSEITCERSRFIGLVFPIMSLEDVRSIKRKLKQDYYDASHIPAAYVIDGQTHLDDDGEPQGTAGAPLGILLRQANLDLAYLAVVRYFGGRKLGTKRLREAFRAAGVQALAAASFGEVVSESEFDIEGPLEEMGIVHRFCMETGARIVNIHYNKTINATLLAPDYDQDRYRSHLPETWTLGLPTVHRRVVAHSSKE
ncbi:MAG: YigZ family protein [Bacilli bacterium]|jgi:putative IMPACT (imprinted ancient) family translation regulator